MSWQFSDDTDRTLFIQPITKGEGAFIRTNGGEVVEVKPEEAVGIAGNLIAFSRAEATVVPGKLPEVSIEKLFGGDILYAVVRVEDGGWACNWEVTRDSIENARRCARDALAVANRIEEYLDSEEHANKVLTERRDAIAGQLTESKLYIQLDLPTRTAVDRIIELEDRLKETSK